MTADPQRRRRALGPGGWLEDIGRARLPDATPARRVAENGASGIAADPAIFDRAVARHHDGDAASR